MQTKERILVTAISLFNQQGTGAVSTNHIAEAAGISPGNLYYHFHNKEEIIRGIFERLFHAWDVELNVPTDRPPTLGDVENLVRTNFNIMWEYSFVYREMVSLLLHDDVLRDRFVVIRQRGFDGFQQVFGYLVSAGILRPPEDADTVTRLAELCWLVSEFWLATLEISGRAVGDQQMQHGIDLLLQVLRPYMVE